MAAHKMFPWERGEPSSRTNHLYNFRKSEFPGISNFLRPQTLQHIQNPGFMPWRMAAIDQTLL